MKRTTRDLVAGSVGFGLAVALVGIVFAVRHRAGERAERAGRVLVDFSLLHEVCERYFESNDGRWPDSLEALIAPDGSGRQTLRADSVPLDPWGRPYFLEPPLQPGGPPYLVTLGRDGRPRGEGEDADIAASLSSPFVNVLDVAR
jgi:hypothetical protein